MRTIGKTVRISQMLGTSWKQQLNIFLREYRATPHSTTGRPPAELIFQRKMNIKIPSANPVTIHADKDVRQKDTMAKAKMKAHSDVRRHATPSNIKPGDVVLCRQQKKNKLTTPYSKEPLTVTQVKGPMVTAGRNGYAITRNSSFFKKIHPEALQDPLALLDPDLDLDDGDAAEPAPDLEGGVNAEPAPLPRRYPFREHRQPPAYLRDYN